MGKFSNTWRLMKSSWAVLRADKEMMLFPLFSGIACLVVLASFAIPLAVANPDLEHLDAAGKVLSFALAFAFYFVNYFVITFFNAAMVACAVKRLEGGDPTVGYGLSEAMARLPLIAGWAALAATVGMILRAIEERAGFLGKLTAGLLGMAWTIASFLVVPVLVVERKGPIAAFKESTAMLKRTWGESLLFNFGFGYIAMIFGIPAVLLGVAGVAVLATGGSGLLAAVLVAAAVLWVILLSLAVSAMQAIFQSALYLYARNGTAPAGFDDDLVAASIRVK